MGKYHRSYFRDDLQIAFADMQAKTGVTSNTYVVEAVRQRLVAEGYLRPPQKLIKPWEEEEEPQVVTTPRSRVRRRRGKKTTQ